MTNMSDMFTYKLNGIRGLSICDLFIIDASKVVHMDIRERVFMIFDREYPFVLRLEYYLPQTNLVLSRISGEKNEYDVHTLSAHTQQHQIITKRYKTREDADRDYNAIERLQKLEKWHKQKLRTRLFF